MIARPCQSAALIFLQKDDSAVALTSHPVARIRGAVRAPGDKSCSHRALMFSAVADGVSHISGLLEGDDVLRTGAALRACGAGVEQTGAGQWRIEGAALRSPAEPLDFGNSGTGVRLMMGLLSGYHLEALLTGDESLRARPMARVLDPLKKMGVRTRDDEDGRLPLTLKGGALKALDYAPPHASAQVKSAILLAGLNADGVTTVREARRTRDHTERMLRGYGADVTSKAEQGGGRSVSITGGQRLSAIETGIPGDPSSAAFLAAAAAISGDGEVLIENVMSNDTRDGFFDILSRMGAHVGAEETGHAAGERLVSLTAATGALKGLAAPEGVVPSMIDEFPILGVVAAFASGETVVTGAEELRVKESDRIGAVVAMLRANGVEAEERPDGFAVQGCGGPPPGGGLVETRHDHRIAMSALVMGTAAKAPVTIDDASMIATSYPAFFDDMSALGARFEGNS